MYKHSSDNNGYYLLINSSGWHTADWSAGLQFYWPFSFHILSTRTGFCHRRKNLFHAKNPECLWTPSATKNVFLHTTNETDNLRCSVLCIQSTSEVQSWGVSKNFQVPLFQQHREMPVTVSITPSSVQFTVWVIYFSDPAMVSRLT